MKHIPAKMWTSPDKFVTEDGREFEVFYDENADDPRERMDEVIVVVLKEYGYNPPDWGGSEIEEAARAIWDYSGDCEVVSDAINIVPGWTAVTTTIRGYSQGDWADVIALSESTDDKDRLNSEIETFRRWKYGEVYLVIGEDGEALGGIYADSMEEAVQCFIEEIEGAA